MKKNLYTFTNEPFTNFDQKSNKENMIAALENVHKEIGKTYPLIIDGKPMNTPVTWSSQNPGKIGQIIGHVSAASVKEAEIAHVSAQQAFQTWRFVDPYERAQYLVEAARIIRSRKFEFNAWTILESGKNWKEADADTAEAIDFLEYYARQMMDLSKPDDLIKIHPKMNMPDEETNISYLPIGVGICIPPWNFPLAILVGMTAASIVAGNTVILKPSELTSVIASKFMEVLNEIKLPPGVVNLVTGYGHEIGDYLVDHPKTRFINFTGSKLTGCRIHERAAKIQPGQIWLKKVVAEMGGKDGLVIDETADLDLAAQAIVDSAFGFQGQKCSAGSRAIVVDSVYDDVLQRVIEKTKILSIGSQINNYAIGPVADEKAFNKIMNYIEIGKEEGRLILGGHRASEEGYYIEPTIFSEVKADAVIFKEEIFGPVLSFTRAKNYKEAIALYNATEYGLTGAFHSSVEERIQEALIYMECGNLYINKKCTGALVGVHPFGGFNMSGTDSKAGGPDYLLHFLQAKVNSRIAK